MRPLLGAACPPRPPKEATGFRPQGGASWGSKARPPARFNSLSKSQKYINIHEPKRESTQPCLVRPLRCLFSMMQPDRAQGPLFCEREWLEFML